MTIPIATTTVTIKGRRPQMAIDPDATGYDAAPNPPDVLAEGVRATITLPQGSRRNTDSDQVDIYSMRCDVVPVDVNRFDTVIDENTSIEYQVLSAMHSHPTSFGLEHIVARLYLTKGLTTQGGGTLVPA
jgi:hypothetical protein